MSARSGGTARNDGVPRDPGHLRADVSVVVLDARPGQADELTAMTQHARNVDLTSRGLAAGATLAASAGPRPRPACQVLVCSGEYAP